MLNITAHGNLGNDPKIKYFEGGKQVANFSLAARTGKEETTWLKCAVWGKRVDTVSQYLHKGSKITIAGQGKLTSYTSKDGIEKQSLEVNVTDFTLPPLQATNEGDIPF